MINQIDIFEILNIDKIFWCKYACSAKQQKLNINNECLKCEKEHKMKWR